MPVIKVYGVPKVPWWRLWEKTRMQRALMELTEHIRGYLAGQLNLSPIQVSVFYPADMLELGLGEELVAEILLNETEERSPEMMRNIANAVAVHLRIFRLETRTLQRRCRMVEAMTVGFQPERHGYAQKVLKS